MSHSRNETIAFFQALTDIQDLNQCVAILEEHEWHLETAAAVALSQHDPYSQGAGAMASMSGGTGAAAGPARRAAAGPARRAAAHSRAHADAESKTTKTQFEGTVPDTSTAMSLFEEYFAQPFAELLVDIAFKKVENLSGIDIDGDGKVCVLPTPTCTLCLQLFESLFRTVDAVCCSVLLPSCRVCGLTDTMSC